MKCINNFPLITTMNCSNDLMLLCTIKKSTNIEVFGQSIYEFCNFQLFEIRIKKSW